MNENGEAERISLRELSRRTQTPPRTIRYYIAERLLPGPVQRGRRAHYGPVHVKTLRRIRELKERGLTLTEIRLALSGVAPVPPAPLPEPSHWIEYPVAEDVVVRVRADIPPWRMHHVRRLIAEAVERLAIDAAEDLPAAAAPPQEPETEEPPSSEGEPEGGTSDEY